MRTDKQHDRRVTKLNRTSNDHQVGMPKQKYACMGKYPGHVCKLFKGHRGDHKCLYCTGPIMRFSPGQDVRTASVY